MNVVPSPHLQLLTFRDTWKNWCIRMSQPTSSWDDKSSSKSSRWPLFCIIVCRDSVSQNFKTTSFVLPYWTPLCSDKLILSCVRTYSPQCTPRGATAAVFLQCPCYFPAANTREAHNHTLKTCSPCWVHRALQRLTPPAPLSFPSWFKLADLLSLTYTTRGLCICGCIIL